MITIPRIHVGQGTHLNGVTTFPIWSEAESIRGLEWKPGPLRVSEREGSTVVEELVVTNTSGRMLVALEGDLLAGGQQDRMLVRSMVLEPDPSSVVPVFCVEHGRWSGQRDHTARARRGSASVRAGRSQHEVGNRIGRYETVLGATASSSMLDHLDRSVPLRRKLLAGQTGVVIGIAGRVIGAELFGSSAGLSARWQGIMDAAALDARLAPDIPTLGERARGFARHLALPPLTMGTKRGPLALLLRLPANCAQPVSPSGHLRAASSTSPTSTELTPFWRTHEHPDLLYPVHGYRISSHRYVHVDRLGLFLVAERVAADG